MKLRNSVRTAAVMALAAAIGGCQSPPRRKPLPPIPLKQAVGIVNDNASRISGTLQAIGPVDGAFETQSGRKRSFHLDGYMFYLRPTYLRFELKKFGDRQLLLGSNADDYWYYDKSEDAYTCAQHDDPGGGLPDMPLEPHHTADALGFTIIDTSEDSPEHVGCVQRIVDDYQQVLCLVRGEMGHIVLEKEYWLDRYPPQLVRRVIFRDADGVVEMESRLDDYQPLLPDGPMLPTVMSADWPDSKTHMRFTIKKWRAVPQVGPDAIQFATPRACQTD